MKLSIRLQNHGRKNHPLWWIVIAPNRKNIFGRYIEHVGYWSPRQGVFLQRQIVLNIPRIKYWMSCGAIPTFKVQKFLSLWNILPAPWYYKKTQEQLALEQPQGEQLTDKKKRKIEWKEKRRARQILDPKNYYKEEARFKFMTSWKKKIDDLKRTQERENEILRDLLLYNEFSKLAKINELSGKSTFSDTQQLKRLKQSLAKAKAELTLIKRNNPTTSAFQQTKSIKTINELCKQIRNVELQKLTSISDNLQQLQNEGEYLTEDLLKTKLEYELITKKIEKNFEELESLTNMSEPVLLQQYADFLVHKKQIDPEQAYIEAQREFIERGVSGYPVTKFQLEYWDDIKTREAEEEAKYLNQQLRDADLPTILKKAIELGDLIIPVKRTVHPIPDLKTYIPEEYYEPLANHDFQIKVDDPLSPYEELQKYHQKKVKKSSLIV